MGFDDTYKGVWDVGVCCQYGMWVSSKIPHGDCRGNDFGTLVAGLGYVQCRDASLGAYVKNRGIYDDKAVRGPALVTDGGSSFLIGESGMAREQFEMEARQLADAIKEWNREKLGQSHPASTNRFS